jgi:DNA-binding LacI/PurR family transcriptional regulator
MGNRGRVTLEDVAAVAGVSRGTVSNVVRKDPQVGELVRLRVLSAIDKLGYRPSAVGRNLVSGRTGLVALAIPNFAQPHFADIARLAVYEAEERDLRLAVQQTDNRIEREREISDAWNLGTSDGLIFSPSSITDDEIESRSAGVELARLATRHLVEIGRTRIAMIGDKSFGDENVVSERAAGYRLALADAGLSQPFDIGVVCDWTRRDGEEAMRVILDHGLPFDAVFCANDLLAVGAMRELRRRGVSVPSDVAVIGVDDIEDSEFVEPGLTTVAIDRAWIVTKAFEFLSARLDDPGSPAKQVDTPFHLVIRESTRPRP